MAKKVQEEKVSITQLRTRLTELVGDVNHHYNKLSQGLDPVGDEPNSSTEAILETLGALQDAADGLQANIRWLTRAYQQVAVVRA